MIDITKKYENYKSVYKSVFVDKYEFTVFGIVTQN